jgi:hypothetical protein
VTLQRIAADRDRADHPIGVPRRRSTDNMTGHLCRCSRWTTQALSAAGDPAARSNAKFPPADGVVAQQSAGTSDVTAVRSFRIPSLSLLPLSLRSAGGVAAVGKVVSRPLDPITVDYRGAYRDRGVSMGDSHLFDRGWAPRFSEYLS